MPEEHRTVIKEGGSNIGLIFLGLAVIIAAVVGFMFYQSENSKNNAVSGAASAVEGAAKDVSDAAKPE